MYIYIYSYIYVYIYIHTIIHISCVWVADSMGSFPTPFANWHAYPRVLVRYSLIENHTTGYKRPLVVRWSPAKFAQLLVVPIHSDVVNKSILAQNTAKCAALPNLVGHMWHMSCHHTPRNPRLRFPQSSPSSPGDHQSNLTACRKSSRLPPFYCPS